VDLDIDESALALTGGAIASVLSVFLGVQQRDRFRHESKASAREIYTQVKARTPV